MNVDLDSYYVVYVRKDEDSPRMTSNIADDRCCDMHVAAIKNQGHRVLFSGRVGSLLERLGVEV